MRRSGPLLVKRNGMEGQVFEKHPFKDPFVRKAGRPVQLNRPVISRDRNHPDLSLMLKQGGVGDVIGSFQHGLDIGLHIWSGLLWGLVDLNAGDGCASGLRGVTGKEDVGLAPIKDRIRIPVLFTGAAGKATGAKAAGG